MTRLGCMKIRHSWMFALALCGCANSIAGGGEPDARRDAAVDADAPVDAGAPVDATDVLDGSDAPPAAEPPILADYVNCPLSMFTSGVRPQDFSSDVAVDAAWTTAWARPRALGGALQFGPHPMTDAWWDNYSAATANERPGDVLVCARLRITPEPMGDPNANVFDMTVRLPAGAPFDTAGMVLGVHANMSTAVLTTRLTDSTWVTHDSVPLPLVDGVTATLDLLLYAQGDRFAAEVRDLDTARTVRLGATYALPAGGGLSLVGWRMANGAFVDRLLVGAPSPEVAARLGHALP